MAWSQSCVVHACRQGSSDELALLVADFGLLDGQLAQMCDATESGSTSPVEGDVVARLAVEGPDLRARLGIGLDPCPFPVVFRTQPRHLPSTMAWSISGHLIAWVC